RWGHILPFHGIKGRFSPFLRWPIPSFNGLDIPLELNGRYYLIPADFSSVDNFRLLKFKTAADSEGPAGIYLYQGGFRWNTASDMRDRVEARIRIADVNGIHLSALEYHEDSYQAQQPTLDELYPNFVRGAPPGGGSAPIHLDALAVL